MQVNNSSEADFDVVVIAESFGTPPPEGSAPWALQKLGPFTLLELCLEWVSWFDSPNVIVATTGSLSENESRAIERRWNHSHAFTGALKVLPFANCHSVNDVLREVESRRLLKGDFVLVDNVATMCSANLSKQLKEFSFRARLKENKNNVLTMLYTPATTPTGARIVGYERASSKLLWTSGVVEDGVAQNNSHGGATEVDDGEAEEKSSEFLSIPKSHFTSESCYRADLQPCGVYMCTYSLLPQHFSANYDLQTVDGIVDDILHNEEFLAQNIHVEVFERPITPLDDEGSNFNLAATSFAAGPSPRRGQVGILPLTSDAGDLGQQQEVAVGTDSIRMLTATSYAQLLQLQRHLIQRECFPLTFDNALPFFKDFDRLTYIGPPSNVYLPAASTPGDLLGNVATVDTGAGNSRIAEPGAQVRVEDAVFCKGAEVHSTAKVSGCVFGTNAKIGKESVVKNCLFGDFARIGENCHLEDCVFGPKVVIGSEAHLRGVCVLPEGSKILASDDLTQLPSIHSYGSSDAVAMDDSRKRQDARQKEDLADSLRSGESCAEVGSRVPLGAGPTAAVAAVDIIYEGNVANFLAEVTESMQSMLLGSMESGVGGGASDAAKKRLGEQVEKMRLEINASKLAYNISIEELSKNIFKAFLSLPQVSGGNFKQLATAFKEWEPLWRNYYKKDANKAELLHAVEESALANENFHRLLPKFLHFLYEEEFLPEDVLIDWYHKLPAGSPMLQHRELAKLIAWVEQDDEDDDDDE